MKRFLLISILGLCCTGLIFSHNMDRRGHGNTGGSRPHTPARYMNRSPTPQLLRPTVPAEPITETENLTLTNDTDKENEMGSFSRPGRRAENRQFNNHRQNCPDRKQNNNRHTKNFGCPRGHGNRGNFR